MNVDLEARLKRLMLFRVVMVTTLLFIATYVEAVSETLRAVNPLYFVIVATYALTVAYVLALRFLPRRTPQVYAQVAGDLLIITALVYVTGGVRTGFLLLYPLSVLSATMLVSRSGARSPGRAGHACSTAGCCWPCARGCSSPARPAGRARRCRRARSLYSVFVARRGLRHRGAARLVPRREPAARGAAAAARRRWRWPTCASSTR